MRSLLAYFKTAQLFERDIFALNASGFNEFIMIGIRILYNWWLSYLSSLLEKSQREGKEIFLQK